MSIVLYSIIINGVMKQKKRINELMFDFCFFVPKIKCDTHLERTISRKNLNRRQIFDFAQTNVEQFCTVFRDYL